MDRKLNIKKYFKFSLASNIIFNNSIFARCCKKGNKGNDNNGCYVKKVKYNENNITPDEEQSKEETPKENDKPEKNKDYKKGIDEFLKQLSNIKKNNDLLTENKIDLNKENLENEINSIDSDEKANNIKFKLNKLESELNKNLNELKSNYNIRLQEITEGNTKLGLKLDINLAKKDIDNLGFNKNTSNINDVKTKLEALETQYFGQLESKCNELKTKYDGLVEKKNKLPKEDKKIKQVEQLCKLTNEDFVINNYTDFNNLNSKISNIESLIKGDEKKLKKDLEDRYNNYLNINKNLSLNITDFDNNELSKQINNFKIENFSGIDTILVQIYKSITVKITKLKTDLENKNKEITAKIALIKNKTGFTYSPINVNINENTKKDVYDKLVNDINQLQNSFINKLSDLKKSYDKQINEINTKLKDLGLYEINLNDDLDNLTFDKLTNETISVIENAINDAENKCKETIETFKKECTNSLEQVKDECNDDDIYNKFSSYISTIKNDIISIKTTENKNAVDKLISDLKDKITEAKNKKAEEEAKKAEEKKKEEEAKKKAADKEEKKRKEIIRNFKDGYEINNTCKLTIKLEYNKFKLYFNKTILIAESENEIKENNIKDIDYYKNSTYTMILNFANRNKHCIKNLRISNIIDNINDSQNQLNSYFGNLKHCHIHIDIYFNNGKHDDSFYDINTGQLFFIKSCSFTKSHNSGKGCIVPIGGIENYKFTVDTDKAYFYGKYGKLVPIKDFFYFEECYMIKDINDSLSREEIEKFSKISLYYPF